MADGQWTFLLCDQDDVTLDEITDLVTSTISPRLNRPFSHVLTGAADSAVWKTPAADGRRALSEGVRTIKAYRNGVLVANPEIWRLDYTGDKNTQQVQITCFDSMVRAAFRLVRDSIGRVDAWDFGSGSLAAGDLVKQLLENSMTYDDAFNGGEPPPRQFPLTVTGGTFTATTDVSEFLTDGPRLLGDLLYTNICDTGVADLVCHPLDTSTGGDPGVYGRVSCVPTHGSNLTGTVHFDYDTGTRNVDSFRRSFDMSTMANWLRYLLAPKISPDHWRGSIESPDAVLPSSYRTAEMASRATYGALLAWEVIDSDANTVRALYHALFKTESTLRINPRQLVYLTPTAGGDFEPFADYWIGDRVAVNLSDNTGPAVSDDVQRIYGCDLTVDVNGVESPGELIVSPDGASA